MDVRSTLLPVILLAGVGNAYAADHSVETPFYLSVEASKSKFGDLGEGVTSVTGVDDEDNGYSFGVGFVANDWLAVEMGYVDFGKAKLKDVAGSYSATALEFTAIASFEFVDNASIYAKLGTAHFDWDAQGEGVFNDNKDWTSTVGAGLAYDFNAAFSAKIEYQNYTNVGGPNIAQTSLGLRYRF
ncbi:outer membrane beta-barrel protein [Paraferrimonas sp. SM1919]|uniref:outer membrane beta-barrel protein n=1 Tax=Paraferrimonas sp. SM1919 TaxID=2662263 RepID=UPI0013D1EA07|nr:outer membrane beta-barrel protein [Paraferrimonas sp. SM1919]